MAGFGYKSVQPGQAGGGEVSGQIAVSMHMQTDVVALDPIRSQKINKK